MDKINFLIEKTNILTAELNSIIQDMPKITEENKINIEKIKNELNENIKTLKLETINLKNEINKPNLLINGNFIINQRGKTEYTGSGTYTVDRWKFYGTGTLNVNSDNTITYTIGSNNWNGISYCIENPSFLSNKTFTVSIKGNSTAGIWLNFYQNGNNIDGLYTTNSGNFYLTKTITFPEILNTDKLIIAIVTRNTNMPEGITNNSFTLEYVKLEHGLTATPLKSKTYEEELNLCQRYYISYKNKSNSVTMLLATTYFGQANYFWGHISLPTAMRTTPSITYSNLGDISVVSGSGGTPTNLSSLSVTNQSHNILRLYGIASGVSANKILALQLNTGNSYLNFDAEIY